MAESRRCAVLGDPIDHSLSPVLHRAGYAHHGLDWDYGQHRVAEEGLAGFLTGLDARWRGLSLTMPLKRVALGLADTVSDRARLAGAANTLVLEAGKRMADNTDIPGAVAAIRERYDGPVVSATILGGGATATSTGIALVELGARMVRLAVRSPERAAETASVLRAHPAAPAVEVTTLAGVGNERADVVVSTIPAAAQTGDLVERCARVPVVFEVIYHPWPTPLAASVGTDRILVGGLDLLVHQAALQFESFTGLPAPLARMRAAGEHALVARG
ncbi:shikimate dehydrogenase [Nocardioides sp. AE5]|uniref:shikimate dehydrogenase n=1 Tax=Nocardioides sp. AE5 TaxID=2962573 RepID=UPI0028811E64|nr:shikimate dehydrogenase [Nocardioides sp. AE5]MDT0201478.1 shikimate dehydrogenase [Nocardioides sp. AE5]